MEVDVTKQKITVNKLISSKKETITIQGDMIVPDVKPDILNTIDTVGNVCIYKKEVLDGRVRLDGSIWSAVSDSVSVWELNREEKSLQHLVHHNAIHTSYTECMTHKFKFFI